MNKFKAFILLVFLIVAAIIGFYVGRAWLLEHDNEKIKLGRDQMYQEHYSDLAKDAQRRREIETKIREGIEKGLAASTKEFDTTQAARTADDLVTRDKVEGLIQQKPDYYANRLCTVPNDMLAQRNKIRLNGATE